MRPWAGAKRRRARSGFGQGLALEQRDEPRDALAQLAPVDDHVDRALLEQEFRALEALGQRLAHRLLDHARAGEADERPGLGDDDISNEGKTRRDATHGGIGQHRDERLPRRGELVQCRGRLRHLHEREEPLLHARPAARGEAHEREMLVAADLHRTHEPLADHRAHGAREEPELEDARDQRHAPHRAFHHHHRIGLAGLALGFLQALDVLAAVLELERIDREHFRSGFRPVLRIEEEIEALARGEAVMERALRADVEIVLEVGEVQHRVARRTLAPQPFGDGFLLLRRLALDLGWQELAEPAHESSPTSALAGTGRGPNALRNSASTLPARSAACFGGASAISCTMRLPITTASATRPTRCAVAGSRMPKPTPTGTCVRLRMRATIASTSRVSMFAAPVTPFSDT